MTEEQKIHKIAEKRVKEWIEYAKKEYGWENAQYDLFEEPMFELCVQVATLATRELQDDKTYLNNLVKEREQRGFEIQEDLLKEKEELQKQISILLSCKNCPDNKGGYICEKEYNDKCLAQKIQYIKELQEEVNEWKTKFESLKRKCSYNMVDLLEDVEKEYKQNKQIKELQEQIEKFKKCETCKHFPYFKNCDFCKRKMGQIFADTLTDDYWDMKVW